MNSKMSILKLLLVSVISGIVGFYIGADNHYISVSEARKTLTNHLDAAQIPDGDLAVESKVAPSARYIIARNRSVKYY